MSWEDLEFQGSQGLGYCVPQSLATENTRARLELVAKLV